MCRHCGRKLPKCHGRGLCQSCHHKPAVRALYPRGQRRTAEDPDLTAAELEAIIAAQRATMPGPDGGVRGRPRQPRRGDYWKMRSAVHGGEEDPPHWAGWLRDHTAGYELHPDTEPEAIAQAQREAVRAALEELGEGWTVAGVSDVAVLPAWTVTRRLNELGVL